MFKLYFNFNDILVFITVSIYLIACILINTTKNNKYNLKKNNKIINKELVKACAETKKFTSCDNQNLSKSSEISTNLSKTNNILTNINKPDKDLDKENLDKEINLDNYEKFLFDFGKLIYNKIDDTTYSEMINRINENKELKKKKRVFIFLY